MVSVNTVQPSLNQEFLRTKKNFKMSLYTLNEKMQSRDLFYIKSNAWKYIWMMKKYIDPWLLYDILWWLKVLCDKLVLTQKKWHSGRPVHKQINNLLALCGLIKNSLHQSTVKLRVLMQGFPVNFKLITCKVYIFFHCNIYMLI